MLDDPKAVREAARSASLTGTTAGLARGYVQGNIAILPVDLAGDFERFCERNPKPCPVIGRSNAGRTDLPALGENIDIRTDVPRYRVFRDGACVDEPTDVERYWRDDLVTFVLGCSFSFEEALIDAGIPLRHIAEGKNVGMWRTSIATVPAGPFNGPLVVSMRPMTPADAIRAIEITSRFPGVHGSPVHIGKPDMIGVDDLARPDFGDAVDVRDDELPVFWACGVTPQAVVEAMRPPFFITHYPGSMLVTDIRNDQLATPRRSNERSSA
ncbi:MAG TPA: putative hydro-lyase [Casimicrobiaceae bacterium]|nr:putative hydro-lyase [Casimicrobiaceae bacterium]